MPLHEIEADEAARVRTGIAELDRVLRADLNTNRELVKALGLKLD